MNSQMLFQICLILHLTGLTLMAGTTVVDYITFKTLSKMIHTEREKVSNLLALMKKLSGLLGLGAALLIFSGIGLYIITGGAYIHQFWFKIKLLLILALILNGSLVGSRQESKLKHSLNVNGIHFSGETAKAVLNLKMFYAAQMVIFFVIIVLAVFKFN